MDRSQLLQHFDTLAETPDAVAKLRNHILKLACSGKLVVQNSEVESATEALARFRAKRLPKGTRKIEDGLTEGIEAGQSLNVPNSWATTTIREVCELATGATPSRTNPTYFGGLIRWLVSGDIHQREISDCAGRITERGLENSNCKILEPDSVLIALNGQGKTRATVAILRVPAACNQSLVAMKPIATECLTPEYLYWNLRSRYYDIREITGQKQRRGLNMGLVGELALAIPPLEEQQRIFERVAELFALCDELEARQTAAREHRTRLVRSALDHLTTAQDESDFKKHSAFCLQHSELLFDSVPALRQAILSLAVQGCLLPQSAKDEPAEALLARIRSNKRRLAESSGTKPPKEWPSIEASELLFSLPKNWTATRLGNVAIDIEAGFSPQCEGRPKTKDEWGVLKISAVSWDEFDPDENKALPANVEPRPEYEVRDGDFIMSRANTAELVAKSVVANKPPPRLLLNDKTLRVRFTEHTDKRFLNMVNNSSVSRTYYAKAASGTSSSMKNITREGVAMLPLALPPLAEQQRIVAKVDELMRWCDALEARLTAARTTATHLLDATLHQILTA